MLWYSLVMASNGVEVASTPEEPQSVSRPASCGKEPVSEPRKKSLVARSAAGKKSRKRRLPPKPKPSKSKRKRSKRSKFVYSTSPSSDTSETSSSDDESSSTSSSSVFEREKSGQSFQTNENGVSMSPQVLDFAVSVTFQGLSKSERKNLAKEAPVPQHADLWPKRVDRFMKKYFKRKGISFNPSMDRRQLNLAARILDPIGPLTQLWEAALAASEHQTDLDPALVVKSVHHVISLVGNASFCGVSDRRKSLLAKVFPETLDLLDERNLFKKNSADLFSKNFKKAMLKEFKHDKIMDNLFGCSSHGNRKQFFRQQPRKGPAFSRVPMPDRAFVSGPKVPKTAVGRQGKLSSGASRQEQRGAINRAENNSRYFACFKTISRGTGRTTEFATHSSCAYGTFESFKDRFSCHHSASEVSRPFGSFCSKLASYFKRPRRSGGRCGLQTRVHNKSTPNRPAPCTTFLKIGLGQNRYRDPIPDTERGPKTGSTRSRPVSEQSFSSPQTRWDFTSSDQPQGFERFSLIHTFQNGGYPSPARSSSAGGLAGQSGPEGCLFCSTDLEGSPEVSLFPLEGHTSGICPSHRDCSPKL